MLVKMDMKLPLVMNVEGKKNPLQKHAQPELPSSFLPFLIGMFHAIGEN